VHQQFLVVGELPLADGAGAKVALGEFESAIATGALDAWRGDTNNVPRARPKWC